MNNGAIYYIPEAKTQPNFHQSQPNYQQGPNQPNYYQNQPSYGQSQPGFQQTQPNYYQNQNQPNVQQYQQNPSQQPNYQQNQYDNQQKQPIPQQTQPSTQQYQPNVYQNQPSYGQTQPTLQQGQPNIQQNQPTIPQGLSSFPLAESNYVQQPNPQQNNIQQSQPNLYQTQSTYNQPQPNYNQTQPSIQPQNQPQNVQQSQPNLSQQQNVYQSQQSYGQTQTNYNQGQPSIQPQNQPQNVQQSQSTFQQENFNIHLDSFAPLQSTNMTPSQALTNNSNMTPSQVNFNMSPSQVLPNNYNMAFSQMPPSNQANKFGISISITGENTYQEEAIAYTLYSIQGYSQKGQFSTTKGYVDFINIQFLLVNKFVGSKKHLEIPDKTLFLKLEDGNVAKRRNGLEKFLKMVACSTEMFYCLDFQNFLSTSAYPAKQQIEFLKKHNPFIMYNNPANQQQVDINIIKEHTKGELLTAHVEYVIQGADEKGQFLVSRRYKDFVKIRETFLVKWPGIPLLHLPSVTSVGKERVDGLVAFLRSIPKIPFVYQSTEWQLFIRYSEHDFRKKIKPFHKKTSVLKTLF